MFNSGIVICLPLAGTGTRDRGVHRGYEGLGVVAHVPRGRTLPRHGSFASTNRMKVHACK